MWTSNEFGRSLFGWKIKEEIFAVFFILVILALGNDEKIVEKTENPYIQGFILMISIYCLYNRIPWSLAFIMVLLVAFLFSDFLYNVKGSLQKINQDKNIMKLGAKVFGMIAEKKGILKKVRFECEESDTDVEDEDLKENLKDFMEKIKE
jgi:hypothetical protein